MHIIDAIHDTQSPEKNWKQRKISRIKRLIIHCSDTEWTLEDLYQYDVVGYHKDMLWFDGGFNAIDPSGLPGLTYHFVGTRDGTIYQCNGLNDVTSHAAGSNTKSLSYCLMYRATDNPTGPATEPSLPQLSSLINWAGTTCTQLGLNPYKAVRGHRELKGTGWFLDKNGHKRLRKVCPGMQVDLTKLRQSIAMSAQIKLKQSFYYGGDIDGIWGPKTKAASRHYWKENGLG